MIMIIENMEKIIVKDISMGKRLEQVLLRLSFGLLAMLGIEDKTVRSKMKIKRCD